MLTNYCFFVLYYESDIVQKQIWEISLFKFKMGHKAAKTVFSINKQFGLKIFMKEGTGMGQEVLKKETRALKLKSAEATHEKLIETS